MMTKEELDLLKALVVLIMQATEGQGWHRERQAVIAAEALLRADAEFRANQLTR